MGRPKRPEESSEKRLSRRNDGSKQLFGGSSALFGTTLAKRIG